MIDRDDPVNAVDVLLVESSSDGAALAKRAFETGRQETTLHVVSDGADCLRFLQQRGDFADAPQPGLVVLRVDPLESSATDTNADGDGNANTDGDGNANTDGDGNANTDDESLLETIAADPALRRIPCVVCLPADASRETVRRCYDRRANAVIVMPDEDETIVDYMRQIQRFWVGAARLPPDRTTQ